MSEECWQACLSLPAESPKTFISVFALGYAPGWGAGSPVMTLGEQSVKAENITRGVTRLPGNALRTDKVISYRSTTARKEGPEKMVRVAVAVELMNPGTQPWMVKDAALVGKDQEAKPMMVVWQRSPIPPDLKAKGVVVVELELTAREARGTFTLKLWDESGKRLVTLGNVTFP